MVGTRIHIAHNRVESTSELKIVNAKQTGKKTIKINDFFVEIPDRIFINEKIRKLFMRGSFGYLCDYDSPVNSNKRFNDIKLDILRFLEVSDVIYGPCYRDFMFIRETKQIKEFHREDGVIETLETNETVLDTRLRDSHKLFVYPETESYVDPFLKICTFDNDVIEAADGYEHIIEFTRYFMNYIRENPDVDKDLYRVAYPVLLSHYLVMCGRNDVSGNFLLLRLGEETYKLMFLDRIVETTGFPRYESYFRNSTTATPYDINYKVSETYTIDEFKNGEMLDDRLFSATLKMTKKVLDK